MKKGMMKSKNAVMLVTLGIIAVAIVIIAVIGTINKGKQKQTLPTVEVVSVQKGNVTQEVDATGNVESEQKKTFYSPVNATIQNMTVQTGDSVEMGQSLIGFNLENLEADNQRAELSARSGLLDLQDAQEQANTAAAKVANAKAEIPVLESQIENKKNEIASLKQQIADAQNDAQAEMAAMQAEAEARAAEELQKAQDEYKNDILPKYEKELAELKKLADAEDASASALMDYQYKLENPPAEPDPSDYVVSAAQVGSITVDTSQVEAAIENASSELVQLQSDLASKQAIAETDAPGLSKAAQEKMRISNNLSELESKNIQELLEEGRKGIQAEFKGVISDAQVTQGATVSQGMQLFTLQSTEQVCVDANISKYDFDKVKEGQKATVTLGANKYKGTVKKVSKIAIPNEKGAALIPVSVHIDNPDENIFIGVEAKVNIQAAEAKDALLLPVEVVNIGKEGSFCYVVENGVITKKDIETGVTSDSFVEVKSGLKNGDQVILDIGSYNEGDSVTAKETGSKENGASK